MHSPGVDPVKQEIYYYIESLERKETATKESIQSPGEGSNQFNEPQEPSTSNVLKQEMIFAVKVVNSSIYS